MVLACSLTLSLTPALTSTSGRALDIRSLRHAKQFPHPNLDLGPTTTSEPVKQVGFLLPGSARSTEPLSVNHWPRSSPGSARSTLSASHWPRSSPHRSSAAHLSLS